MHQATMEMPRYKCHKEVRALKIQDIRQHDGGSSFEGGSWHIFPAEKGYSPIEVPHDFVVKHKPKAGGYYVVYGDGYASFSPADAFEGGYARIDGASALTGAQIDTLIGLVERGPLYDGDVPSKSGRDQLIAMGLAMRVVAKGEDGYTAATYAGRDAYKQRYGNAGTIAEAQAYRREQVSRRPNPANGAPKPANHNPVA